jgi:hypothetical protein
VNASLQVMLADRTGLPDDLEPYLTALPLLIEADFAHDESKNALSVSG